MSPRGSQRVSIAKPKSKDYFSVAENFYSGADMARAYEHWNAAGVLIVHAAIAYTDAITIKVGGVKSRGEDHMAVVDLLKTVVVLDEHGQNALKHLIGIIEEKNIVSYSGEIYTKGRVDKLWKNIERYRTWALSMLSD